MTQRKRNWLREASMNRLSYLFQNRSENALELLIDNKLSYSDIDKSDLNEFQISLIQQWMDGLYSGRQCLLALIDNFNSGNNIKNGNKIKSSSSNTIPLELQLLGSSLCLPDQFLCDRGVLFDTIFSKPPNKIIKETFEILASKALEKHFSSLRADQINLALKQLRIESLNSSCEQSSEIKSGTEEDLFTHSFKISILTEMIRYYVKTKYSFKQYNGYDKPDISKFNKVERLRESCNSKETPRPIEIDDIDCYMKCNLDSAIEEAKKLSLDDLEKWNLMLKPYVQQLSSLKSSVSIHLKDFDEKRAYISLGLAQDAPSSAIRKAYHAKAILLHPDKPGGSTLKFQELQKTYQDLLSKRQTEENLGGRKLEPEALEELNNAKALLDSFAVALDIIKQVADKCTKLGHLNIQLQKHLKKISCKPFPSSLKTMMKWMTFTSNTVELDESLDSASSDDLSSKLNTIHTDKENKEKNFHVLELMNTLPVDSGDLFTPISSSYSSADAYVQHEPSKKSCLTKGKHHPNIDACSPSIAIDYVELMAQNLHLISSQMMKLPSCGFRYGLATAIHSKFMKTIELSMSLSLNSMKVLSALVTANDQVTMCREKVLEVGAQGLENQSIHDILLEMVHTAFSSATATVRHAAEKCVEAAMVAIELYGIAKDIVSSVEEQALSDSRANVVKIEQESDLCEEDRVLLADHERRKKEGQGQSPDAADKDKAQSTSAEENNTLEALKDKIKNLQIQLRLQHIEAIQKLNTETRSLQLQLQQQICEIVSTASSNTIDSDSVRFVRNSGSEIQASLLSLLADFIDSSCNSFRLDLDKTKDELREYLRSISSSLSRNQIKLYLRGLLKMQLRWMTVLNVEKCLVNSQSLLTQSVSPSDCNLSESKNVGLSINDTSHTFNGYSLNDIDDYFCEENDIRSEKKVDLRNDETKELSEHQELDRISTSEESTDGTLNESDNSNLEIKSYRCGPRLALLPDYRSKTLWIAALIDKESVERMVSDELPLRLKDYFDKMIQIIGKDENFSFTDINELVTYEVYEFCNAILDGIKSVHSELVFNPK